MIATGTRQRAGRTEPSRARSRRIDALLNTAVLAALWAAYAVVRGLVGDSEATALDNAARLLAVQQSLGLDIEAGVQAMVQWPAAHIGANSYYLLHFPLTLVILIVAFARSRERAFPVMRDALIACTSVALVIHLIVPMAPPRMLPGFIDSSLVFGPDPYSVAGSEAANQFAAMPSMHVAWAVVVGYAVWRLTDSLAIRALAVAHPFVTTFVVIVTGHHFVTDVVIGAAAAIVALAVAVWTRAPMTLTATQVRIDGSVRAAEDAELVAFRVGEHDPRHVTLADVDSGGAVLEQPGDLGGLIVGAEVEMQSVLGRLVTGGAEEQDPGHLVGCGTDLEDGWIVVDDDPAECVSPPAPERSGVDRLDHDLFPFECHACAG